MDRITALAIASVSTACAIIIAYAFWASSYPDSLADKIAVALMKCMVGIIVAVALVMLGGLWLVTIFGHDFLGL